MPIVNTALKAKAKDKTMACTFDAKAWTLEAMAWTLDANVKAKTSKNLSRSASIEAKTWSWPRGLHHWYSD